jgi:hypothetical protein
MNERDDAAGAAMMILSGLGGLLCMILLVWLLWFMGGGYEGPP